MNFYEFTLYLEGQAEDIVKQNPELQVAYDQGIRNANQLKWILSVKDFEPVQDIVPLVFAFEKNKVRLPIKDIFQYKNPGLLRIEIEKLGQSKNKAKEETARQLKDNETTKIGEFGEWLVVMPHTRESSCQWGKGTTWCTAATQSGNLFLNYVGSKNNDIVLYYLIKKGEDSTKNPKAKISVGFIDGQPILQGERGGLTVDAKNEGMNEQLLKDTLKDQYNVIMQALKKHSATISGKHPAKAQLETLAKEKDSRKLFDYMQGMKEEEQNDFVRVLLQYNVSIELLKELYDKETPSEARGLIASSENTPPQFLEKIYNEINDPNNTVDVVKKSWLKLCLARNKSTPPKILSLLGNEDYVSPNRKRGILLNGNSKTNIPINQIRISIIQNPSTPVETLQSLARSGNSEIKQNLASTFDNLSGEGMLQVLLILSKDPDPKVRIRLARSINKKSKDKDWRRDRVVTNVYDVMNQLAEDPDFYVRAEAASSEYIPAEKLIQLADDPEFQVRISVARNPNITNAVALKLLDDEVIGVFSSLVDNSSVTNEILEKIVNERPPKNTPRGWDHNLIDYTKEILKRRRERENEVERGNLSALYDR